MEHILLVCALVVCSFQGSRAVTPVFVQKGDDLLLNVTNADDLEDFVLVWNFNKKAVLVRFLPNGNPKVSNAYTGRVEFSVKKFSVKLKNLQEADSGVYTARVTAQKEQILAEYNVTVQAPVSPVGLTVDSVSNSSDSCNLTVTCRTQDSHISSTFRCDNQTCSQEGGDRSEVTTSGASLHVYLENDSIICNHSNQFSWTRNMTNIQDFCPRLTGSQPSPYIYVVAVVILVVVVLAVIVIFAGRRHLRQRRKNQRENIENTIYAVPEALPQSNRSPHEMGATAHPAYPTNAASGPSPNSEYSLVGPHSESTETRGNTLPESLYAQIDMPVGRAKKRQENGDPSPSVGGPADSCSSVGGLADTSPCPSWCPLSSVGDPAASGGSSPSRGSSPSAFISAGLQRGVSAAPEPPAPP